jgi:hypothetical protein
MSMNDVEFEKAKFIFYRAFSQRDLEWDGPEYDENRAAYKARVESGPLKGQVLYIHSENLQDETISLDQIAQQLLTILK